MKQDIFRISYTLDTIHAAARQLWQYAHTCRVWAFSGEMGAGKTTLIRALCRELGITDPVSSPTFSLINEYRLPEAAGNTTVLHMDWYRLSGAAEAVQAGMEDALAGESYCFVEWPERAAALLPPGHVQIAIQTVSEMERMIVAQKT